MRARAGVCIPSPHTPLAARLRLEISIVDTLLGNVKRSNAYVRLRRPAYARVSRLSVRRAKAGVQSPKSCCNAPVYLTVYVSLASQNNVYLRCTHAVDTRNICGYCERSRGLDRGRTQRRSGGENTADRACGGRARKGVPCAVEYAPRIRAPGARACRPSLLARGCTEDPMRERGGARGVLRLLQRVALDFVSRDRQWSSSMGHPRSI